MLYGRDAERASISALLAAAGASRSGAVVVRGEPGIGKSALLADARDHATDMQVFSARGVESESELAFSGLHQLLRPALHNLDRLPAPQAAALEGAFGLSERSGDDRFLISAGCLTLLAEMADDRPVLCLIDDAQWLDTPSVDALLFVARRLDAEGVVMIFAAREDNDAARRFEARGLPSIRLSGLDPAAAAQVVGDVDGGIAPAVRDLLVELAGGNALALVELPSALSPGQLAGREPLPASLPLTPDVERLFLERVRRLPQETQRLLTIVAVDDTGRLAPIVRAAGVMQVDAAALDAAESAGLVSVHGSTLELRHPLVRSAIYQGSSSRQLREAHLALAEALPDDQDADQRAWHRAVAAIGPDAAVADALEQTADRAMRRSGHAAAATALEKAAELSDEPAAAARLRVAAATSAWHAGQSDRTAALIAAVAAHDRTPALAIEIGHLDGAILFRCGDLLAAGATLMGAAVDAAPVDSRKALELLFDAGLAGVDAGDYARVVEAGRRAGELRRGAGKDTEFLADLLVGVGSLCEGKTAAEVPLVLDVIRRADKFGEPRWLIWAAAGAALTGEETQEAAILRRAAALARASGAIDALTFVLLTVSVNGVISGRFTIASEANEGLGLAREAGMTNAAAIYLAVLAWFAGAKGDYDTCAEYAESVARSAATNGEALANSIAEWALAMADLTRGHPDRAITRLQALRSAPPGVGHPLIVLTSTPDLVEACVRAGRDDDARASFEVLSEFARPGAPSWALALAARCRALLATPDVADGEYIKALDLYAQCRRPFDRARAELLFGEHLRRGRQRQKARDLLRSALETFEALGAAPWAERARNELRATGEVARKRDPSTLTQLSPQEFQITRLVAGGMTNKEVAEQLFLSPRTIDAHLRNVFSKLGVTSRIQLAHLELDSDVQVTAPSPLRT